MPRQITSSPCRTHTKRIFARTTFERWLPFWSYRPQFASWCATVLTWANLELIFTVHFPFCSKSITWKPSEWRDLPSKDSWCQCSPSSITTSECELRRNPPVQQYKLEFLFRSQSVNYESIDPYAKYLKDKGMEAVLGECGEQRIN